MGRSQRIKEKRTKKKEGRKKTVRESKSEVMRGVKDKTVHWHGFIGGASLVSGASELPAAHRVSVRLVITLGGGCTQAANILQRQPPLN